MTKEVIFQILNDSRTEPGDTERMLVATAAPYILKCHMDEVEWEEWYPQIDSVASEWFGMQYDS